MNQTVNEAVDCHRKLWHGMADKIREFGFQYDSPVQLKKATIKELFPVLTESEVKNECFLCEFASEGGTQPLNCGACPLVAAMPTICLNGRHGEFVSAYLVHDKENVIRYAEQIAELPVVNPMYGG